MGLLSNAVVHCERMCCGTGLRILCSMITLYGGFLHPGSETTQALFWQVGILEYFFFRALSVLAKDGHRFHEHSEPFLKCATGATRISTSPPHTLAL